MHPALELLLHTRQPVRGSWCLALAWHSPCYCGDSKLNFLMKSSLSLWSNKLICLKNKYQSSWNDWNMAKCYNKHRSNPPNQKIHRDSINLIFLLEKGLEYHSIQLLYVTIKVYPTLWHTSIVIQATLFHENGGTGVCCSHRYSELRTDTGSFHSDYVV